MIDRPARWGVVATVREPLDLVVPFVCHHLAIGAGSVTLFLDDPGDPGTAVLEQIKGVRLIRCDDAHWARLGWPQRPQFQTPRQNSNFRWALNETGRDWLVHLDADEFLWLPNGIEAELGRVGAEQDWLAIAPLERVLPPGTDGLFAGAFRGPVAGDLAPIYGAEAPYLAPRGLAGYASAKPMVPARTPHQAVTHRLVGETGGMRPHAKAHAARILHFEGLTPIHWAYKQLRYAAQSDRRILMRPARYDALREIIAHPDPRAAALARFDRTYRLPQDTLDALAAQNALFHPEVDIAAAVAAHAPHFDFDPTGARLDAALAPLLDEVADDVAARRDVLLKAQHKKKGAGKNPTPS